MISSSNFFNKSFFRPEETIEQEKKPFPILKRDNLTPWGHMKQLPFHGIIRELS